MERISKEMHSKAMRAVKSKDTSIEIALRKALWHQGVRYRKNYKVCDCRPDIVIVKYRIAIFCDGDFWHGNKNHKIIKNNKEYWQEKIKRNVERDLENTITLRDDGWSVMRFWESEIRNHLDLCVSKILAEICKRRELRQ